MMNKIFEKYFRTYAEPLTTPFALYLKRYGPWTTAVSVPVYAEAELVPRLISSLEKASEVEQRKVLLILVINGKQNDSPDIFSNNVSLMKSISANSAQGVRLHDQLYYRSGEFLDIAALDFSTEAHCFPPSEGVGLARKIGCDLAAQLFVDGTIQTPWIRNTDADVEVEDDYFKETTNAPNTVCIIENFLHTPHERNQPSWKALIQYECFLRYYELGLMFAGSPYAFQTIGSTITVHAEAYCAVRGFPKRLAGEDFHILNKLAKVGSVVKSDRKPIRILDRPSQRVPFGTGAAVSRISNLFQHDLKYEIYDPRCFSILKFFLSIFASENAFQKSYEENFDEFVRLSLHSVEIIEVIFKQLGVADGFSACIKTSKTKTNYLRHFHNYFDALKSLRFIHLCRDHFYPSRNSDELPIFLDVIGSPVDTSSQVDILQSLRDKSFQAQLTTDNH